MDVPFPFNRESALGLEDFQTLVRTVAERVDALNRGVLLTRNRESLLADVCIAERLQIHDRRLGALAAKLGVG